MITKIAQYSFWDTHALLIARVLVGGMFLYSAYMKLTGIDGAAGYIASVGLPASTALAWLSVVFEIVLGATIITGLWFRESVLLLAVFVLFLAFMFHGSSTWKDAMGFMVFLEHLAIVGGLLFMAAHGPGNTWKLGKAQESAGMP